MKTNLRPNRVVWLLIATLMFAGSPILADVGSSARVLNVGAKVAGDLVRIEAKASGPFEYTTYRPSENLFVVDLAGVSAATASTAARVLKSELVSSYRVLQYRSGDRAIVRIEVLLRRPMEPRVERQGDSLVLTFGEAPAATVAANATPVSMVRAPVTKRTAAPKSGPATVISKVDVTRVAEQTQVVVGGDGRLVYQTIRLSSPDRLVLDFLGTRPRVAEKAVSASIEPVRGVRVGQFKPGVTRVVIDLGRATPYDVTQQGNAVLVSFGSKSAPVATEVPAPRQKAPEPETKAAAAQVKPAPVVQLAQEKPVSKPAEMAASAPPLVQGKPAVKQEAIVQPVALPDSLTQKNAGLAATAPSVAEPKLAAPETSSLSPSPSAPARVTPVPQGNQKYSGEPISLNLKDIDLKDFFRLIHEISGLNVVLDPNVKGTVTLVLDDVPWDQALDIVLKNNNLDKELDGNVLRIATRDTIKKEAESRRDLVKAQAEAVDPITRTKVLSYAKATAMREPLKRFLSSRGEILADERSNTLIIRDIPSVFPDMEDLIAKLDKRTQQVEIESRVVLATRTFARDIGTQFGFATTANARTVFGGLVAAGVSPITATGLPSPPLVTSGGNLPLSSNFPAVGASSGASFANRSNNFALDFLISAAESKGVGKMLSKPRIITQNNEKATVKQGTRIPIQTLVNNTISTQFIDATLTLEVTPQITADGTVFMDVKVLNESPDFSQSVGGIPAIATQSAETKVLINDGGTVVIGGVIVTKQTTTVAQVPLFGSIPLIGHLFKRTSVSSDSKELLFFLTPRIVAN